MSKSKRNRLINAARIACARDEDALEIETARQETVTSGRALLLIEVAYMDGYLAGHAAGELWANRKRANSEKTPINPICGEIAAESEDADHVEDY